MKKQMFALLTATVMLGAVGLTACGTPDEPDTPPAPAAHTHSWTLTETTTAICGEAGRKHYTCDDCGDTKTELTDKATGDHAYGDDNVCDVCGYVDMSETTEADAIAEYGYYLFDEDESETYSAGDIVLFGSYPRTLINKSALDLSNSDHIEEGEGEDVEDDAALVAALDALKGTLPTPTSKGDWTSYGYYDAGVAADYMFYKDVEYDGSKYRGVYLTDYRAYYARLEAGTEYSYIDDEGYQLNTVYWFKFEPIRWIVLDYAGGELFINSLECLEAQPFQDLRDYDKDVGEAYVPNTETYMNDWESSSLRKFLNGSFYDLAFGTAEKALIQTATLQNKYTGIEIDNKYQTVQNNTQDKVFLLSYDDLYNTDYGMPERIDFDDDVTKKGLDADTGEGMDVGQIRRRSFTDYTTVQGLHRSVNGHTKDGKGACHYIIRSAGVVSYAIAGVTKYGSLWSSGKLSASGTESYDTYAGNGNLGVTPSVYIKVGK